MKEVGRLSDLNFFIDPNAKKEHSSIGIILIAAIAVAALGVVGLFGYMTYRNNRVSQDIARIETELASPQVVDAKAKVDLVNQKLKLLQQYDQGLTAIESALSSDDKIKKAMFDTIAAALPPNITLSALSVTSTDLSLEAISSNPTANAELIHNLKATGLFSSVDLLSANVNTAAGAATTDRVLSVHATLKEVKPE